MSNPIITAYLAENAAYIGEDSAAAISSLNDAEWPAVLEALDEFNSGGTDPGLDCAVTVTHETLADFDAARSDAWSERGSRSELTCASHPALHFERFQLHRGDQRKSSVVLDLSRIRVVLY
jgi:hypothetical protein